LKGKGRRRPGRSETASAPRSLSLYVHQQQPDILPYTGSRMATRTITRTRITQTQTTQTSTRTEEEADDGVYRIDFGTHAGRTLDDVPPSWIRWVIESTDIVEKNKKLRDALIARGDLTKEGKAKVSAGGGRGGRGGGNRGGGTAGGRGGRGRGVGKASEGKGKGTAGGGGGFKAFSGAGNSLA
jgi:hypothetical protein